MKVIAILALLMAAVAAQAQRIVRIPVGRDRFPLPSLKAAKAEIAAPAIAWNSVSLKSYAAKIQPILSNVCAECHARPQHASRFVLKKLDPNYNDPELAEKNLAAVLNWIDPAQPAESPLLKFALVAHGPGKQPPLRDAKHPAYATLEQWVFAVVPPMESIARRDPMMIQAIAIEPKPMASEPGHLPKLPLPEPLSPSPGSVSSDPFDPAAFNRTVHPRKK